MDGVRRHGWRRDRVRAGGDGAAHLVEHPHDLRLRLWVNGVLQQDRATPDIVADIPTLREAISTVMTLEPGDIVALGTPAGVGVARNLLLRAGDVMTAEVQSVGRGANTVVTAPD